MDKSEKRSKRLNGYNFIKTMSKSTWFILKLAIFIDLFVLAIFIKLLIQIMYGAIYCLEYMTNLGEDSIDGKIIRFFESVKRVSCSFSKEEIHND